MCVRATPLTNHAIPKHQNAKISANSSKGTFFRADDQIAVKSASDADSAMPPTQATNTQFRTRRCLTANSPVHHARILPTSCSTGNSAFPPCTKTPAYWRLQLGLGGFGPGDLDLVARFEGLARTVADTLDAIAPRGPAAPSWIGLDRQAYLVQLTGVQHWADTILRQHYSTYELRDCWLPGTMRRVAHITSAYVPECVTRRRRW